MTITFKVCNKLKEENVKNFKRFNIDEFLKNEIEKKIPISNTINKQKRNEMVKEQFDKCIVLKSSLNEKDSDKDGVVCSLGSNSFVFSAWEAYNKHHHLVIRPDNIWMAIMTQFSLYLNKQSEHLRDRFVDFQDSKTLVVKSDYPILEANFDKLIVDMTEKISENIKDPSIRDWAIPTFSTTTQSDKVAFSSVLMSSMKKYFQYVMQTDCGLPKVTMHGTISDWLDLKERALRLSEFDVKEKYMEKWLNYLLPVLDKFIESVNGKPDIDWWNKIISHEQMSGGGSISGWLAVFCLFNNDGDYIDISNDKFMSEDYMIRKLNPSHYWPRIKDTSVPNGYVSTPIILKDFDGSQYNSQLYAGHLTFKIQNKSTLIPLIDWFIVSE